MTDFSQLPPEMRYEVYSKLPISDWDNLLEADPQLDIVTLMSKAEVDTEDVLSTALIHHDLNTLKALVQSEVLTNVPNTVLAIAVLEGDEELIQLMLSREDTDVNGRIYNPKREVSLFEHCINEEQYTTAQSIIEHSSFIPEYHDLLAVIYDDWPEMVEKLLEYRRITNLLDEDSTALIEACRLGRAETVRLLLGVEGVAADVENQLPLRWAVLNGHTEVVNILMEQDSVHPGKALTDSQ